MKLPLELEGTEFDWFACDRSGQFAVFASAGLGEVPASVGVSFLAHQAVSDSIESANWGSDRVWDELASCGLYVYDWGSGDRYRRQRVPAAQPEQELLERLCRLPKLPRFDFEFGYKTEIAAKDACDAT